MSAPKVISYSEKLRDPRWQAKRLRIMERDRFTCRDCRDSTKHLHVHHCHYIKGEPWDTPDELLLTLCEDCHEGRQMVENEMKVLFGHLFAGSPIDKLESNVARLRRVFSSGGKIRPRIILLDEHDQPIADQDGDGK